MTFTVPTTNIFTENTRIVTPYSPESVSKFITDICDDICQKFYSAFSDSETTKTLELKGAVSEKKT